MESALLQQVQNSVYRVHDAMGGTAGTAFAVGSDGLVVTCMHVLEQAEKDEGERFTLTHYASGTVVAATLLAEFSSSPTQEDVGFLHLSDCHKLGLEIACYEWEVGMTLYSFGFPEHKNLEGMPGRATVTGPAEESGHPVIAISSEEVSAGFSGGPAVDETSGLVVGVVVSIAIPDRFDKNRKAAFLVPAKTLLRLNPSVAVGSHPALRQYGSAVCKHLEKSAYFIPGVDVKQFIEFFRPPNLSEHYRVGDRWAQKALVLDDWIESCIGTSARPTCVVGDAGSGKSALLRYIAWRLASSSMPFAPVIPIYIDARSLNSVEGLDFSQRLRSAMQRGPAFGFDLDLPPDFFARWTQRFAVHFVVFIDGCDELQSGRERLRFFGMLEQDIAPYLQSHGHALIIASRDVSELEVLMNSFRRVLIGPLDSASQLHVARLTIGSSAAEFNNSVKQMTHRALATSPLSLLLLLSIFKSGRFKASFNLVDVYEAHFDLAKEEWERRGLKSAVGSEVAEFALDLLSIFAWHNVNGASDIDEAISSMAEFLVLEAGRGSYGAGRSAEKLIRFFTEQGGVIRESGNNDFSWLHLNFRDYLAARAICRIGGAVPGLRDVNVDDVLTAIIDDHWDDPSRESFVRFTLSMFKNRAVTDEKLSQLLGRDPSAVSFCGRVILDGVQLPPTMIDAIAKTLFVKSASLFGSCAGIFTSQGDDPFLPFSALVWRDPFFSIARSFLSSQIDPSSLTITKPREFCDALAQAMSLRCTDAQLRDLRSDERIETRVRALMELEQREQEATAN
jgi:hypothetical protein